MEHLLVAAIPLIVAVNVSHAAERVSVTSVGPDNYKVSVERKYIKTQDCHAPADHTAATITNRRIVFADTGEGCNIEEIVGGH
jgi:hypothetical protein